MNKKMELNEWLAALRELTSMIPEAIEDSASEADLRKMSLARDIVAKEAHIADCADAAENRKRAREREEESHRRWCAVNDKDLEFARARLAELETNARRLELYELNTKLEERQTAALERIATLLDDALVQWRTR